VERSDFQRECRDMCRELIKTVFESEHGFGKFFAAMVGGNAAVRIEFPKLGLHPGAGRYDDRFAHTKRFQKDLRCSASILFGL